MQPGTEVEIEVDRNRRLHVVDAVLGQRESVAQRREVGRQPLPPAPPDFRQQPVQPGRDNREQPAPRREDRGLLPSLLPRR